MERWAYVTRSYCSSLGFRCSARPLCSPFSSSTSLLIVLCSTASSQPSFLVPLHPTDWSSSLYPSLNTKALHGVLSNSDVQIQLLTCRKHQRNEVWKFCLACFFCCFSSFFSYVRQTEVEQASKWMAKPPFPLLALLFMHVIPVPAPSPLSPPSLSILIFLSALNLPPFPLITVHQVTFWDDNPWLCHGHLDQTEVAVTGRIWWPCTFLKTLWKISGSHYVCLFPLSALVSYRVMQGWVGWSFSLITCQWARASEADEVKATPKSSPFKHIPWLKRWRSLTAGDLTQLLGVAYTGCTHTERDTKHIWCSCCGWILWTWHTKQ